MEALQHAVFHHIWETQNAVRGCIVEFSSIDQTTVQSGNNFAAWQWVHRSAEFGKDVHSQTHGAVLQAFQVGDFGDWLFEPAQRLGGHRAVHIRMHINIERLVDFF